MTSINSSFGANADPRPSPRDQLQSTLQSAVDTGEISSTDATAMSSALDSIDSTLRSERTSSPGGKPPSPKEMQEKIASLIQDQVDAGNLTEEQAAELTEVFEETFAGGLGGSRGPGGPGGPPPPPPLEHPPIRLDQPDRKAAAQAIDSGAISYRPDDSVRSESALREQSGLSSESAAESDSDSTDRLAELLKRLQEALQSASGYSASGSNPSESGTGLILDLTA